MVEERHKNIFQKLIQKFKPKIADVIYNNDGNKIGLISKFNFENMDIENLIKKVNNVKEKDTKYLLIENVNLLNRESIYKIERETNLKVLDGINIKAHYLPIVLKKLHILLDENLREKEILFFCGDKNITENFILNLSKEVRYITLVGDNEDIIEDNEDIIEDISKTILEDTGLSIFHSKNIDRILKNYSIIINLDENIEINIDKFRKTAIIFDFSFGKDLKPLESYGIIEDFVFKADRLNIKKNSYIEDNILSPIYEYFNLLAAEDLKGLLMEKKEYSPKSFIDVKIRQSKVL